MSDMIHYSAIFELPDGEHHMHGWSQDISTARLHIDRNILGRRRALVPHEKAKLVSIRQISPHEVDDVIAAEDKRLAEKYPDRAHISEQFGVNNRILEQPVTDEQV